MRKDINQIIREICVSNSCVFVNAGYQSGELGCSIFPPEVVVRKFSPCIGRLYSVGCNKAVVYNNGELVSGKMTEDGFIPKVSK